jgi:dolichol-phosphate mannosyltransferase
MDAIFSFSYKPLRVGMILGVVVLTFALLLAVLGLAARLAGLKFAGSDFFGLLLIVLLLGAIQLVCIGLLGEYVGRIYDEVRRRPLFLIHQIHRGQDTSQSALPEEVHAFSKKETAA